MRDFHKEAAVWYLFTSLDFYESAASECDAAMAWFGSLGVARHVASFGRNNQIYDTFAKWARNFRRGADMAKLGDYKPVWNTASCVAGDVRGMLEQPLRSWLTDQEYDELFNAKIGRVLRYAGLIARTLNNTMAAYETFSDPDPDYPDRADDDDGFPGDDILKWYEDGLASGSGPLFSALPDPPMEYEINRSVSCTTGDEVPWTGVWYPGTGLEKHSLTFAVKGLRMQPAHRVVKTTEELRTEEWMFPRPQTVAVATTWHPVIPTGRVREAPSEMTAKAGEACPKGGIWQPMQPGASKKLFKAGEIMPNLRSSYGITVWRLVAD